MLHSSPKVICPLVPEKTFKGFVRYMGVAAILVKRPRLPSPPPPPSKLSFPRPMDAPHENWLRYTQRFWRRCLKMLTDVGRQMPAYTIWAAPSEFGTYRLCEQRRFRRACASAQSRQNLRCSLIQAVSQEEPSDRKPDPWPL